MDATPPPRSPVWLLTLGSLGVFALVGGLLLYFHPWQSVANSGNTQPAGVHVPADPRLAYQGPYRNVHPDVPYSGDTACVPCHKEAAESFHRHPMGQSLMPMGEVTREPPYQDHHNPFVFAGSRFEVLRDGGRVIQRETRLGAGGKPVYTFDTPVDYVIGSGTHGHSYLTDRDGFLFQTPISWFTQKQIWDRSPGFARDQFSGRPVIADCLYCHANRVHPHPGAVNRYDPPVFTGHVIGCERCHGPGSKHVETGSILDVVNPANREHMTPALRDAVCEQCHLEGEARVLRRGRDLYDFRPGLPLDTVWDIFVPVTQPGEEYRAVSHVEQMHESRCYVAGTGQTKMSCVTCHNPHDYVEPARQPAYYRKKCLECHNQHGCTEPLEARLKVSKNDSCVQCHMQPIKAIDIVHNASTDHRILRTPASRPAPPDPAPPAPTRIPLRPFYKDRLDPEDKEAMRDAGLALVQQILHGKASRPAAGPLAVSLLDEALRRAPDDADAWEAKGLALTLLSRSAESLAAYERALALEPNRERSLNAAATLALGLKQTDKALDYQRRLVAVNPWMPEYRATLVSLLAAKSAWDEARPHVQAWLRLDPGSLEARQAWITCLIKAGKKDEARKEFATIEALDPNNLGDLRRWFDRQMR